MELAVLGSGGECEELAMSYGAASPIGGCDDASEPAGWIPGGVDAGIYRHPLGLIVAGYCGALAKRCLKLALQGSHLATPRRVPPLREQIIGHTDAASDTGFGLGLRLQ